MDKLREDHPSKIRRTGVSNAITAGLLIAGIVVGAFGVYVTMPAQTTTVTQTQTTTATTTEPTTTTQTQTTTQPTTTTNFTTLTTTQPTTVTTATPRTTTTTWTRTTTQPTTTTQTTTQTTTTTGTRTVTETTTPGPFEVPFIFNESTAVGFYSSLMSPLGLFTDYPGSHTIYLADDQALDYHALLGLYYATESSTALSLAQQVNGSIANWGGFDKYWNPVFEVFGDYNTTMDVCGTNQGITTTQGYTIEATVFMSCPGFQYCLFADLCAYHVLLDIHEGNHAAAESEFGQLSGMWDGHGFVDEPFHKDPTQTYQSYKLAGYVIAWKALADNPATLQFALGYNSTVHSVAAVMSKLQSSAGGVWTGYRMSNGQISYGSGISLTNGETTSLFILAKVG